MAVDPDACRQGVGRHPPEQAQTVGSVLADEYETYHARIGERPSPDDFAMRLPIRQEVVKRRVSGLRART